MQNNPFPVGFHVRGGIYVVDFLQCFAELGFEHAAFLDAVAETSVQPIPIQCEVVTQVAECSGQPHVHVIGENGFAGQQVVGGTSVKWCRLLGEPVPHLVGENKLGAAEILIVIVVQEADGLHHLHVHGVEPIPVARKPGFLPDADMTVQETAQLFLQTFR